MDKGYDTKRKSRNLSEKKRRDQFNNLISELNNLIDPQFNANQIDDVDEQMSKKMDKSSVLKCAIEFLRNYGGGQHLEGSEGQSGSHTSPALTAPWKPDYITDDEFSVQMLEALDAFIVVCEVNPDAKIIYSSNTLTNLLNYRGTCNSSREHDYVSLFDLIAPNDKPQLDRLFDEQPDGQVYSHRSNNIENLKTSLKQSGIGCTAGCAIGDDNKYFSQKSNRQDYSHLAIDGRSEYISLVVNFRNNLNLADIKHKRMQHENNQPARKQKPTSVSTRQQYELVRLIATFKSIDDITILEREEATYDRNKFEEPPPKPLTSSTRYFICIGRLDIPRLSYDLKIIAPPLRGGSNLYHNNQFLSKHTLKWRFLWVDSRAPEIIGYMPSEVLGTSGYDYYHWDDLDKLVISHEGLMRDGQASSGPYRFLTKGQQWIWLQTKYCAILKTKHCEQPRKKHRLNRIEKEEEETQFPIDNQQQAHELNSTSLHQRRFKFILCTHTVIGFDDDDGYYQAKSLF